jgi:hypothetical protein
LGKAIFIGLPMLMSGKPWFKLLIIKKQGEIPSYRQTFYINFRKSIDKLF